MSFTRVRTSVVAFVLYLMLVVQGAAADTLSVPFPAGFVGTKGSNSGQANAIINFSTLGISSASFIQVSDSGSFGGTQGNDLSGTLRLSFTNGQVINVPGAINWRITQGSTLQYFGFIPAPGAMTHVISYGSGQQYTINANSNYGLRKIGSSQSFANGTNVNGNAALSGLLTQLNGYLTTVQASGPQITGPTGGPGAAASSQAVDEGQTAVATLAANKPVSWAILGGSDAGRFTIGAASGTLTFLTAPDYEAPIDADGNNTYVVIVQATDANGYTSQQTVTVTVVNLDDTPPTISGVASISVPDGQSTVTSFIANEPVGWSLTGPDAAVFSINATGEVQFLNSPSHAAPTDQNGDNVYQISVCATDGTGNVASVALAVTVLPPPPPDTTPPVITGPAGGAAIPEGETAVAGFTADEPVTWGLSGADAALFVIDPASGALAFATAPDFEAPGDADGDNVHALLIRATDAAGNASARAFTVTVADVAEDVMPPVISGPMGAAVDVAEGATQIFGFTADEPVTWLLDGGADVALFAVDATGALRFLAAPDHANPADADGDNVYLVDVMATDTAGNVSRLSLNVTVTEVVPPDAVRPVISGPQGATTDQTVSVPPGLVTVASFRADETVLWSMGGRDAALFFIDPLTGILRFVTPPSSAIKDQSYSIFVTATDSAGNISTVNLTVIVPARAPEVIDLAEEAVDIVRAVESEHLRSALAYLYSMTTSARDRFIAVRALRTRCLAPQRAKWPELRGQQDDDCRVIARMNTIPFTADGAFQFGPGRQYLTGQFFGQTGDVSGSRRRLVFGEFSVLDDGNGLSTSSFTATIAWERLVSERVMLGYFIAGRLAGTKADSGLTGQTNKIGVAMGTYVVAELAPRLYFDGFLAVETSRNSLDLFGDALRVDGRYTARSMLAGLALSGVVERNGYELRPEIAISYGITRIGSLTLTATDQVSAEAVVAKVGSVRFATFRATPEIRIPLHGGSDASHFIFAPSFVCSWQQNKQGCGGGLRLGLQGSSRSGATKFDLMISGDLVDGTETLSAQANLIYKF